MVSRNKSKNTIGREKHRLGIRDNLEKINTQQTRKVVFQMLLTSSLIL